MISPNVLKLFVGSINMVDFSQNLKSFISQLISDFRNNKLQKHQENAEYFHLFKFRKDVKREFLCRNDFVNKNVQVTENVPVVSRLLDVETQSWTVVCGRTEPWHQPERSFCLFVFFLITSLYWFFRIISVHTTVCLTDAQNSNQRNIYWHTENNRNRNKQKKKDFDQWHFYFNFLILQSVVVFVLSYTTDRKLPALMQITEWNRNSWGAESNVTWLILGAVGLEYHRI